jgi:cytochrome c5
MRSLITVTVLVLGTYLSAQAAGDAAKGKQVYDAKCKMCHGPEGEGNPTIAKMFKVKMMHLGSKEVQSKTDAELKKDITQGYKKMPPVKGLSSEQVDDVIAFVRTLKGK